MTQAEFFAQIMRLRWADECKPSINWTVPQRISFNAIKNAYLWGAAVNLNPTTGNIDIQFPDGSETATNVEGNLIIGG